MSVNTGILAEFDTPSWMGFDVPMTPDTYIVVLARMTCDCSDEPDRIDVITAYVGPEAESYFTSTSCSFEALAWSACPQPKDFLEKARVN